MKNKNISFMTQAAMIAAIYVVLTYVFAPFSFGPDHSSGIHTSSNSRIIYRLPDR